MIKYYTVSFFGHERIENSIAVEMRLDKVIRELIDSKPFVELLVDRDGDFDQLVSPPSGQKSKTGIQRRQQRSGAGFTVHNSSI